MRTKSPKLKSKRIFVGFNYAGTAGLWSFTRVLKRRGYKIDFYGMDRANFNIPVDVLLKFSTDPFKSFFERFIYFIKILPQYDIWHFNCGKTFFFYPINLLILKLMGKKIICTFRGSDVKTHFDFLPPELFWRLDSKDQSDYYRQYYHRSFWRVWPRKIRNTIFSYLADKIIITGPFIASDIPAFDRIIPYGRDIQDFRNFSKKIPQKNMTVLHVPSQLVAKGKLYVEQVFKKLTCQYPEHTFKILPPMNREDLLKEMSQADIIIDQLLVGWYGGQAVEAMMLGKTTLSYIHPPYLSLVPFGREVPIVNTNLWSLEQDLKHLLVSPELCRKIGQDGHRFVRKYHTAEHIASEYLEVYKSLFGE